jgi:hypothetical protein
MSPARTLSRERRERARRRELEREGERILAALEQALAELDASVGAKPDVVIEGKITGDKTVTG